LCDPLALTVAATAVSAAGSIASGIQASSAANYGAQVAEQNKHLEREAAQDAIERGEEEKRRLGRDIAQRVGQQTARLGANNVDITTGSAARTIQDTQDLGAEDQATLAENIQRQVKGHQINVFNFESERRAKKAEAGAAKLNTAFSVGSTVLGGATQFSKLKAKRK